MTATTTVINFPDQSPTHRLYNGVDGQDKIGDFHPKGYVEEN